MSEEARAGDDIERLQEILGRVHDLEAAAAVLGWDQETYMPPAGVEARSRQLATLRQTAHETFIDPEVGELLDRLEPRVESLPYDSFEASLVRVARREYERAVRLPSRLVAEFARAAAVAQQVWRRAREESDFQRFRPHLERLVDLNLRKVEALEIGDRPYDSLLDEYEPGMRTDEVEAVFADLKESLVPIVDAIVEVVESDGDPAPADFLHRCYDPDVQWDFGVAVMEDLGFDFERGRQDRSAHPFSTAFSIDDVRVTTRFQEDYLPTGLFGTLHECGHALYEQGIDPALEGTPLADGTSLGMHESQSRLWENLVGRSRPFWSHYFPRLVGAFPGVLDDVDLESFVRGINRVEPSLIRVEADEVTYNLHIMLRFELEVALLEGDLAVADLPEAWNAKMERYLKQTPPDDAHGVLQDIHWSMGSMGYFPTYTLGNLISAQLFERARDEIPDLDDAIAAGSFDGLLAWLRDQVHRHGRKLTAPELLERIGAGGLEADSWLAYVRRKFGDIYGDLP